MSDERLCQICGKNPVEFWNDGSNSYPSLLGGKEVCTGCAEWFVVCDNCGKVIHTDYLYYSERNEQACCADCWDERSCGTDINWRGYQSDTPIGSGNLFFGVELEVDSDYNNCENWEASSTLPYIFGEHVYCKEDCSLNAGMEIVFPPFSFDEFSARKDEFGKMFTVLQSSGYDDSGNAGMHVHVSRDGLGDTDEAKELTIAKAILVFERFWDDIVKVSRRDCSALGEWAEKHNVKDGRVLAGYYYDSFGYSRAKWERPYKNKPLSKAVVEYVKDGYKERYRAINLTNRSTIEFRIFNTCTNVNDFIGSVHFVRALVESCKEIPIEKLVRKRTLRGCIMPEYMTYELDSYLESVGVKRNTQAMFFHKSQKAA